MPNKNIIATLVLCIGVITSIWLIQKTKTDTSHKNTTVTSLSTINSHKNESDIANKNWEEILGTISKKDQVALDLSQNNTEDTTLTSALAIDVFSKYLLVANQSGGITTDEANNISTNVLSSFEYNNTGKVIYTSTNLKILKISDLNTVKNYYLSIRQKFTDRALATKEDPIKILNEALVTEKDTDFSKLNPFILTYRGVIADLLSTNVPSDAVKIHLDLINAYSGILSDLESMRAIILDPIKGIAGISQYQQDQINLESALLNINNYFEDRLN